MFDKDWINKNLQELPLFKKAFIHRSYLNESHLADESNERLEFLGDSILSLVVSSYLFSKRPNDTEGELTNLRAFIVKTKSLAIASEKLDLGSFLSLSKGEELSGGRNNPQLLANTYEALLGAIYLTFGIDEATKFINETLIPIFASEIETGPPKDAKSQLQEVTQDKTKQSPKYKILNTSGPDHAKEFSVGVFLQGEKIGEGKGSSKQVAEELAAEEALKHLDS
jgi:ribonuclease III